jgi:hypothetical protein
LQLHHQNLHSTHLIMQLLISLSPAPKVAEGPKDLSVYTVQYSRYN